MKKIVKIISLCVALVLTMSMSIPTVAASNVDPYQEIIDRLNQEYSLNIHFATPEESRIYGVVQSRIDVSPEAFEASLRASINANNAAKAEADLALAELGTKTIDESGSGICSSGDASSTRAISSQSYNYRLIDSEELVD